MISEVKRTYPKASVYATTLREVVHANCHLWGAIISEGDDWHVVKPREIVVQDRIGGGDGFVGGMLYAILQGWEPEKWIRFAWATGAMVSTFLTDYGQPADEEQVWSVWQGKRPGKAVKPSCISPRINQSIPFHTHLRKMKATRILLILIACVAPAAWGQAAQKIGYVSTAFILSQLPQTQKANEELREMQAKFQAQGQTYVEEIKIKYDDLVEKTRDRANIRKT